MDVKKIKQGMAPGFWGAVAGAAALAFVGFNYGGWVTGGTATEMAQTAVIDRLVPICVGQFKGDAENAAKLAVLKKTDSWKRAEYVSKQGWATMPGATEANSKVADRCADQLSS